MIMDCGGAWEVVSGGRWSLVLISGGAKNRPDGGAEVGTGGGSRSYHGPSFQPKWKAWKGLIVTAKQEDN